MINDPQTSTLSGKSSGNAKARLKLWQEHSPGLTEHFQFFHQMLQDLSSNSSSPLASEPSDSSTR